VFVCERERGRERASTEKRGEKEEREGDNLERDGVKKYKLAGKAEKKT